MPAFTYSPIDLEDAAVRLVRLIAGQSSSEICCDLFEALYLEAKDGIPYEALSYTWGGPEKPAMITIDRSHMNITQNLHDALLHLRYTDRDRILWVDAICIDQENKEERGHQVRHMGNIYKEADRVIVWLGLGTPGTDIVMELMDQQHKLNMKVAGDIRCASDELQLKAELEQLLRRSWFTRIWILQEIAFARRASIVCGWKSVSAQTFAVVPALLGASASTQCQAVLDIMPGGSRNTSWWSKSRTLRTLLDKFRECCSSDERDMVFALLNMSSDACNGRIRPDYVKDETIFIKEITSFLICPEAPAPALYDYVRWTWIDFLENLDQLENALLLRAAQEGDLEGTGILLKIDKCDPNFKSSDGRTALMWAVTYGHKDVVELLLATGRVALNIQDERGWTALICAAKHWCDDMVQLLLATDKVDINIQDKSGWTALMWAATYGHKDVVELLLATGRVALNTQDKRGWTALICAAKYGCEDVVKLLLATDKVEINIKDTNGKTAWMWAETCRYMNVVDLLLATGKIEVNAQNRYGRMLLILAAQRGHLAVVKRLLEDGAEVNPEPGKFYRKTALQAAAEGGHLGVVERLLKEKADVGMKTIGFDGTAEDDHVTVVGQSQVGEVIQSYPDRGEGSQHTLPWLYKKSRKIRWPRPGKI